MGESRSTEKIFTNWRENIDENNFRVHHRGAVPAAGREVKDVPRRGNPLLAFNKEADAARHDDRHLFMGMRVFGRDEIWGKAEATDHQIVAHDHLPLDTFRRMFDWNRGPVHVLP